MIPEIEGVESTWLILFFKKNIPNIKNISERRGFQNVEAFDLSDMKTLKAPKNGYWKENKNRMTSFHSSLRVPRSTSNIS